MKAVIIHLAFWSAQAGLATGTRRPGMKLVELPEGVSGQRAADEIFMVDNHPEADRVTSARITRKKGAAYSMSAGDVAKVGREYFLCESLGWRQISGTQFRAIYHRATGTHWKIQDGIFNRAHRRLFYSWAR